MDLPMHCCFNDELGLLLKGDIDSDMPPIRFVGRYSPVRVIKSATSDKYRVLTDSIRIEYVLYLLDDGSISTPLGVFPIVNNLIFLAAGHLTPLKLPRILDTDPLGCLLSNL
ncbi:hypothetical protein NC651_035120 [Populus alba x Populus x berolinensis]|nr:hypothetical protein NC651_035120 [Populus alba x Populus x berolinensis]